MTANERRRLDAEFAELVLGCSVAEWDLPSSYYCDCDNESHNDPERGGLGYFSDSLDAVWPGVEKLGMTRVHIEWDQKNKKWHVNMDRGPCGREWFGIADLISEALVRALIQAAKERK